MTEWIHETGESTRRTHRRSACELIEITVGPTIVSLPPSIQRSMTIVGPADRNHACARMWTIILRRKREEGEEENRDPRMRVVRRISQAGKIRGKNPVRGSMNASLEEPRTTISLCKIETVNRKVGGISVAQDIDERPLQAQSGMEAPAEGPQCPPRRRGSASRYTGQDRRALPAHTAEARTVSHIASSSRGGWSISTQTDVARHRSPGGPSAVHAHRAPPP